MRPTTEGRKLCADLEPAGNGDKAFGTSTHLCIDERFRIASDGIIFVRSFRFWFGGICHDVYLQQKLLFIVKIRGPQKCIWKGSCEE